MKKALVLLASLQILSSVQADGKTYSRYRMPTLPVSAFVGPAEIKSQGLDEERVGSSTYTWTIVEGGCREVTLTMPVECREVDDGAYGALYCDLEAGQAGTSTTLQNSCPAQRLDLTGVAGFSVLSAACSYNTIHDLLGDYLPEGQIEGIEYISLSRSLLAERASAYLTTDAQKNAFANWLSAQKSSDLRMRAKVVRNNVWGGQGADEWVLFCSKAESRTYLLTRNLWSE